MEKYDDLLEEVRSRAAAYMSTAKIYIPKMYNALMNESKDISPEDARDRIEKDCFDIWAKRTILDALPDEAKNQKKQESGRLGQKKRNFAAVSAAPEDGVEKIILDTNGRPIDERSTIKKSSEDRSNGQVKTKIKECPSCPSSSQESKDALKVYASVTNDKQIAEMNSEGYLDFELSVLAPSIAPSFDSDKPDPLEGKTTSHNTRIRWELNSLQNLLIVELNLKVIHPT